MKKTIQIILIIIILALAGVAIYASTRGDVNNNLNNNSSPAATVDRAKILTVNGTDQILGDANAPVTIVEYSDFQCPYCVKLHPIVENFVNSNPTEVRWVFRHFPLPFHPYAKNASIAAEAAGKQGKFWEYGDLLTQYSQADGTGIKDDDLQKYAQQLGLDMTKFNADLSNPDIINKINANTKEAEDLQIDGTPASYIISKSGKIELVSGVISADELKAKIDKAQTE